MVILIALASLICLAAETSPFVFSVVYLAAGLAVVTAIVFLCRTVPARNEIWFCIILAAAAFAIRGLFVLLVPTEPVSDFSVLYHAACQLAQRNNVLNDTPYFQRWAYQSGFVVWMALWIRLFGADVCFFQGMNCLCGAGTAVLVYLLARRFASPQGARAAGLLYLLYPASILLSPVLTNQHLSEFLLLAALYVMTGGEAKMKPRVLRGAAAGLLLTLSGAIRPSAVVAAAAALAALLLELLKWREAGRYRMLSVTAGVLVTVGACFLASRGLSWLVQVTEVNRYGLENNVPEWKFILGLNLESGGEYSYADEGVVFANDQLPQAQEAARRLLMERLAALTPGRLLALFGKKIKRMWGGFEPTWWTFTQNVTDLYAARGQGEVLSWMLEKYKRSASGLCIASLLLIAAGCVRAALKQEKGQEAALVLTLTALAYFCAHLLIEIQSRYRTTLFAVAFPLAAVGADFLGSLSGRLLTRRKEKRKEYSHDRSV